MAGLDYEGLVPGFTRQLSLDLGDHLLLEVEDKQFERKADWPPEACAAELVESAAQCVRKVSDPVELREALLGLAAEALGYVIRLDRRKAEADDNDASAKETAKDRLRHVYEGKD